MKFNNISIIVSVLALAIFNVNSLPITENDEEKDINTDNSYKISSIELDEDELNRRINRLHTHGKLSNIDYDKKNIFKVFDEEDLQGNTQDKIYSSGNILLKGNKVINKKQKSIKSEEANSDNLKDDDNIAVVDTPLINYNNQDTEDNEIVKDEAQVKHPTHDEIIASYLHDKKKIDEETKERMNDKLMDEDVVDILEKSKGKINRIKKN